jgi:AraC-like DNA-binding protein
MFYQKIFGTDAPIKINVGNLPEFPEHRHGDLEMHFALKGEYDIMIEKQLHRVTEGSMSFVHSMESHAVPRSERLDRSIVVLIVGSSLLKKRFAEFSRAAFPESVYDLSDHPRIRELFVECGELSHAIGSASELMLEGLVCQLLGRILMELSTSAPDRGQDADLRKVENIERALELIYYNYKEPITVEDAAKLTGYSKSNFCKIFKLTVGEGFHQALNRQRISNAAAMLKVSAASVTDISSEVGFSETKSFCRVFKSIMGVTPGQYRRGERNKK